MIPDPIQIGRDAAKILDSWGKPEAAEKMRRGMDEAEREGRRAEAGSADAEAYSRLRWAVMETLSAASLHEAETPGPLRRRLAELEDVFSSLPTRERP